MMQISFVENQPQMENAIQNLTINFVCKLLWIQELQGQLHQTTQERAIPTGERASRYSKHISNICCRCGTQESDIHLFSHALLLELLGSTLLAP
jgi:hypothetical protein